MTLEEMGKEMGRFILVSFSLTVGSSTHGPLDLRLAAFQTKANFEADPVHLA